jgi:uncharacterized protein YecT (DUF1311 family)
MKIQWMVVVFLIAVVGATKPALSQCEHAGTTAATTDCFDREYKNADAELNRIYKLAFTGLDAKAADNLRKAQRAWIVYRDAQCDAEYAKWGGGSGGPAAHLACLLRLTQLRTRELHKTYPFK